MIAFFDMDRTLLRVDSGASWIRFLHRRGEVTRLGLIRLAYWMALYRLALLDLEAIATRLTAGIAGDAVDEMIAKCADWYESDLRHQVAPAALRAIERHRARGERIVLLTGSSQFAAEAVAGPLPIDDVLCSRIEHAEGRFTGRLATRCFGVHKVGLARELAARHGADLRGATFYSDSYNDLPMLSAVGRPVAVNPDPRLHRHARARGWPIEHWRGG